MFNNAAALDVETYPNYNLVMFEHAIKRETIAIWRWSDPYDKTIKPRWHVTTNKGTRSVSKEVAIGTIRQLLVRHLILTFNGIKYDTLIIDAILEGWSLGRVFKLNEYIFNSGKRYWEIRKKIGLDKFEFDHIDLIEVSPGQASLKIYGGRMHSKKMQDLPIRPGTLLSKGQANNILRYCRNDLDVTVELAFKLQKELELRVRMSKEYQVDMRSKSDAQVAEAVLRSVLRCGYVKPSIPKSIRYHAPRYLQFESDHLNSVVAQCSDFTFSVNQATGKVIEPDFLKKTKRQKGAKYNLELNGTKYAIGIGGIHTVEKSITHRADDTYQLVDFDVASYYPKIIINNKLFPRHLGRKFLTAYDTIVERRLAAKAAGNKVVSDSLKITINGSYGKLSSQYSFLYSPELLLAVTLTGQLSLLMLADQVGRLFDTHVVSANTDGIVFKVNRKEMGELEVIVREWERMTGYEMEKTEYLALHSRDVNNYIAIEDGEVKSKGEYAKHSLMINPSYGVSIEAVKAYLTKGVNISDYIRNCKDIRQFVSISTVSGGASFRDEDLGKAPRWYYSCDSFDAIHRTTNGNKVPKTDGTKPLMDLPDELPKDLDYSWYIKKAKAILKDIGVY